jgi:beta-lactamase regulating signal transducer with metallopeptidase domain
LAHERAHLARGDDWGKALQSALLRCAWWLPGLWILACALDLERELASDELAASGRDRRRYAACLLRLATDRRALAPALATRRTQVAIRVERLLRPDRRTVPIAAALAPVALAASGLAALLAVAVVVPEPARDPARVERPAVLGALPVRAPIRNPRFSGRLRRQLAAATPRPFSWPTGGDAGRASPLLWIRFPEPSAP